MFEGSCYRQDRPNQQFGLGFFFLYRKSSLENYVAYLLGLFLTLKFDDLKH